VAVYVAHRCVPPAMTRLLADRLETPTDWRMAVRREEAARWTDAVFGPRGGFPAGR
jgi:hypothetical protein